MTPEDEPKKVEKKRKTVEEKALDAVKKGRQVAQEMGKNADPQQVKAKLRAKGVELALLLPAVRGFNEYRREQGWKEFL